MDVLLWGICLAALGLGLYAWRRMSALSEELQHLKRGQYYTDNRLKRIPEELHEAVDPLRLHMAALAAGMSVGPDLIRAGRRYRDISTEETLRLIEERPTGDALFVDVRTPREYAAKHVAGARLLPYEELEARYRSDIPENVNKVFIYCGSGERSRLACDFLSRKGYTNLYNIQDGMQAWHGITEGEGEVKFIHFEGKR